MAMISVWDDLNRIRIRIYVDIALYFHVVLINTKKLMSANEDEDMDEKLEF